MKDNSDIDGGGTVDSNRSLGRNQGSYGAGKKTGGNRSRSRRELKDSRNEHAGDMNGNASVPTGNVVASSATQSGKVLRQATAEQIRIAQLLSNGEEEKALKIKVGQVVELTGCDQDTAALSLHDCDGDVAMSVHMILDARANSVDNTVDEAKTDEWQTTSKRHPKKTAATDPSNGQTHDSTTEKGDDWSSKNKDNRDRRSARRGTSERRGGSRLRPGSGAADQGGEDGERRRNRSERRGRGGARGRGEHRAGRGRPTESVSPAGVKDDSQFVNGSTDNDYGSFRSEGPDSARDQTTMPPRFDSGRRGGRGNRGGGSGSRVFNSRGRGSRGRSRMSFGQTRDKSSTVPTDGSIPNWTNEFSEGAKIRPPPNGDEGWDDMNEWDSVWRGETQVFINSKVTVEDEGTKEESQNNEEDSTTEDQSDKFGTTLEDDDPAIVNSVSAAQLNEAAIAAFNHRATEAIKTSLGIGGVPLAPGEPKPQRVPRSERTDGSKPSSTVSSHDKLRLRAAIEEEILGGSGPKHARSKPPPPSKKPEQQVELPRLRGIPSDPSLTGFSFAFGSLDEITPIERPTEKLESTVVSSPVPLPSTVEPCIGKSASETSTLPESTIQEYLSSSLNSNSFQSTERQPTTSTSTVSPVKPPSLSATPNQFHSPLKSVDTEEMNVSADPFQATGISSELSSELSTKLSTRTETQQTTQTQTVQEAAAVSLPEPTSRTDVSSVPSVMDKATQPTPSSSQHNTPNKATGVSRSQQTNAPQNAAAAAAAAAVAGGANILNTLPAMSALLNYSHLATPGQHFPYINIPAMQQHGTIDYEQIVQQQQRIIYDLAQLQTQQQQHTSQTPPTLSTHHSLQNQHPHETNTSMSVSVTSSSNSVNTSNVTSSVPGNGLKSMSSNMRGSTVDVQSPSALPGSALPHMQTVASSGVASSSSGVASTAAPHNVFMPPGYPTFYHNYYTANPAAAAAAAAQVQAAAPPGHHPNAGPPAYNATLFSLMNSMNQQPVSQALNSPPQFGSSIGVGKTQSSNNVFGSYSDRAYASNTSGFDEHLTDMKYSGLNSGKDISNAYGSTNAGGKPSSLGVGPGTSAYHAGGTSGGTHRGNSTLPDSSSGTRNAGTTNVDGSNKSVSGSSTVAPGAGASGFPFPMAGNPGLYNPAGYVPYMPHAHHHHLATQNQQERQGSSSGVPQGTAGGSLPGGPQFGSKGNSGVFPKPATAILQNFHPQTGASTTYWNSLK